MDFFECIFGPDTRTPKQIAADREKDRIREEERRVAMRAQYAAKLARTPSYRLKDGSVGYSPLRA